MKQNLHTHTKYDDGMGSVEEIVQSALAKGFDTLGFSGHSPNPIDTCAMSPLAEKQYRKDILEAKEKYKDQIDIYLGLEQDSLSALSFKDYDYRIGSVHWLVKDNKAWPIDESKEGYEKMLDAFGGIYPMAREYFAQVKSLKDEPVQIIGHLDLIAKYNENEDYYSFEDPIVQDMAKEAIMALIEKGKIFEVNTGAISRGYRTNPYPYKDLLVFIQEKGGKILLNSDSHAPESLDCAFDKALAAIKEAGFKEMMHFKDGKFVPVKVEEWSA